MELRPYPILFAFFLIGLLVWDFLFLPKRSRRIFHILTWVFGLGALTAIFPGPISKLSNWLGLWRPVDGVIYLVVVILIREFFLSRVRQAQLESELTRLVRNLAIEKGVGRLKHK